jgi:hypothetical protein
MLLYFNDIQFFYVWNGLVMGYYKMACMVSIYIAL